MNTEIPKWLEVQLTLWNSIDNSTKTISTKLRSSGKFIARVRHENTDSNLYLILISPSWKIYLPDSDRYSLSSEWRFGSNFLQFHLKPGKDIYVEDLFLSVPFPLTISDTQISSFSDINLSWEPIKFADYYGVFIKEATEEDEYVVTYVTEEPVFSGASSAKLVPYDIKMSAEEVIQNAPFFTISKHIESGQYTVSILAAKKTTTGMASIIARSEEYSVTIR